MNKEIKETPDVKSVEQLKKIIDRYGARQEELRRLGEEQKSDKHKIEEFARLNNINYQKANYYKLSMKADDPRLVLAGENKRGDVIAKLKASDETAGYVHEAYDTDEIKEYLTTVQDAESTLTALGLKFTKPQSKAVVKPIAG